MARTSPIEKPCMVCGKVFLARYQMASGQHQLACSIPCYRVRQREIRNDPEKFKALFWSKVSKGPHPKGCWLYRRTDKLGYGRFDRIGPYVFAHRCAWMFTKGEIPEGMEVAHTCDVRNCCNPDHLFLATHDENMKDCKGKRRHTYGNKNPRAILNDDLVRQLRREGLTGVAAIEKRAAELGVAVSTISHAIAGRTWKHL